MEAEQPVARRWRVFGTLAGAALAGLVGAGLLASRPLAGLGGHEEGVPAPPTQPRRLHAKVRKITDVWTKSECMTYPWLNFSEKKPLWNNLANKGPQKGPEGIVYRTTAVGTGWGHEMGKKVLLILNATNPSYSPFASRLNGRQGFYGSVNLNSGSQLDLKISFKDEKTMKPLVLEEIGMTFFDLDEGKFQHSRESVAANKFIDYYVTPHTETKMSKLPGEKGLHKFSASTFGTGSDNPKDPMLLNSQQKNRAVTFLFENVDEVDVTIAAGANPEVNPRFFTFVMRPSLLCSITLSKGQKKPLQPLTYTPPMESPVLCGDDMRFQRWLKREGETVKQGEAIAFLENKAGELQTMKAERDGVVVKTIGIHRGESCKTRLMDTTIAVVKLDQLAPLPGEPAAVAEGGTTFVNYTKPVGAVVEKGDTIAVVSDKGVEKNVTAPHEGVIGSEQTKLKAGDPVEIVQDKDLASFGKLNNLDVKPGEGGVIAPKGKWIFRKWKVEVDDAVEKGDPVAVIEDQGGIRKVVEASKDGTIVARQEKIQPGDELDRLMNDTDLAVIGKFQPLKPEGWRGVAVQADPEAIFVRWRVHKGDYVQKGDPVAEVQMPVRRLADGRRLSLTSTIKSPAWGTVTKEQPLEPGSKIGDQQTGPNIATLDMGTPWWTWILCVLLLLCCLLCCIFAAMKKPEPAYKPMPPVEEPPAPDGLRLDFEEPAGTVHTVYAKYRPLGIKHDDIAPIIAHEFTVNSYAKQELGVQQEWKLRRIGDEELNDNPSFEEVNSKLHDWMKDFPLWPLPMVFKDKDGGGERSVKFVERPLGIEFTNSAPIAVTKVHAGSPAEEQGIKDGMTVAEVGEMDVRKNGDFRQVMGYFHEGVQPLDSNGRTY